MGLHRKDVICTLATADKYVTGAIVLARSLKLAGTKHELAVIVTDEMSASRITELKKLYTHVIHVSLISSTSIASLIAMRRPDLVGTFTKLALWKQTQFRRILYLDADMLCVRSPDSIFNLPDSVDFAASPEIGFPDTFNSGMMFLRPSLDTFDALTELAQTPDNSFDGGDQGLLNEYFTKWKRLSFMYNCELHWYYGLYMGAIKRHKDRLSIVHFIGTDKPWNLDREIKKRDDTPYSEFYARLVRRWWDVYELADEDVHPGNMFSVDELMAF